jgi:hypothetical protein
MALAMFFSWIILINDLRVPFYLYYHRTIFLIYVSSLFDPTIWLASSALAFIVLAAGARRRSASIWLSVGLLWFGIITGALALLGVVRQVTTIAALATLIGCALGGIADLRSATSKVREQIFLVFVLTICVLLLPVELGSLSYYVLSAFRPGIDVGRPWEMLEMQLWYAAFPLIPVMYAAFLFSWIWAPLLARITRKSTSAAGLNDTRRANGSTGSRMWLVIMGCFVLLAGFLGYYPYFRDPTYPLVGTDIYWRYALPAGRVLSSASWTVAASAERHPLVVLSIAGASKLLGLTVESLLRFAYVALILAFGGAVFILVLAGSRSKTLASLCALVTTVSVPATSGIYTGTVAEWLALIVWILSSAFLVIEKKNLLRFSLVILGIGFGSITVAFLHPWTWIAMMLGLVVYAAAVEALRLHGGLRDVSSVLVVVLSNLFALVLSVTVLWKSQGWRVADALLLIQDALASRYFGFGSWEILVFFSQIWSQFLNPILLFLSILGILVMVQRRDRFAAAMLAWVVAACVTSLVAAPMGYYPTAIGRGETQIFRAMFLTPFQIPAALGLMFIGSRLEATQRNGTHSQITKAVVQVAIVVLFLALLNGALRSVYPLLTDAHNYPNPLSP